MAGRGLGRRRGLAALVERVVTWWALGGGLVLLALVAMTVVSVLTNALAGRPFPGDVELTQMGVAVAVFAFLPYAQLKGANVTADIFTMRAPAGAIAIMRFVAALAALGFALLLTWRMALGMQGYRRYAETTTILEIPLWIAFVPILASLVLLMAAALVTVLESRRRTPGA